MILSIVRVDFVLLVADSTLEVVAPVNLVEEHVEPVVYEAALDFPEFRFLLKHDSTPRNVAYPPQTQPSRGNAPPYREVGLLRRRPIHE